MLFAVADGPLEVFDLLVMLSFVVGLQGGFETLGGEVTHSELLDHWFAAFRAGARRGIGHHMHDFDGLIAVLATIVIVGHSSFSRAIIQFKTGIILNWRSHGKRKTETKG
jgi:hypothetical protein